MLVSQSYLVFLVWSIHLIHHSYYRTEFVVCEVEVWLSTFLTWLRVQEPKYKARSLNADHT